MNEVIRAAAELQAVCDAEGWLNSVIGGLALQRWGEPRETIDVDLTLLTGFGNEQPFIDLLLAKYESRIDDAARFALLHRVLLLRAPAGVGLDIALAGLPFEEQVIRRSTPFSYPGDTSIRTCSAEDLIVLKAFAARDKDRLDLDGIIIRQTGMLDWDYVVAQLRPLAELKGDPEILPDLKQRRARFEQ